VVGLQISATTELPLELEAQAHRDTELSIASASATECFSAVTATNRRCAHSPQTRSIGLNPSIKQMCPAFRRSLNHTSQLCQQRWLVAKMNFCPSNILLDLCGSGDQILNLYEWHAMMVVDDHTLGTTKINGGLNASVSRDRLKLPLQ
jgi:hypothetical protein